MSSQEARTDKLIFIVTNISLTSLRVIIERHAIEQLDFSITVMQREKGSVK